MARGDRRAQGLARVAVVVRAGAAPLWWAGVFAAGVGRSGAGDHGPADRGHGAERRCSSSRRPSSPAPAAGGTPALARSAARAGQARRPPGPGGDRAQLAPRAPLVAAAGVRGGAGQLVRGARRRAGMLLAGCGTGLRLKAAWLGRRERAEDALLWVRVDWLAERRPPGRQGGQGVPQHGHRGGRRGPGRGAPPHRGARVSRVRPPDRPRSSSAGGGPSPGWSAWRRAPGRGTGRCRRGRLIRRIRWYWSPG